MFPRGESVFQVYTYEPDLSPIGCIKKSFNLIKGHFGSTFLLMFLSGLLCWIFIPQIFSYLSETIGINRILTNLVTPFIETLPISEFNAYTAKFGVSNIMNDSLAKLVVSTSVAQIFIQYTLPLRSILCGLWYKELNGSLPTQVEKKKASKKRPSEKLMEESHKRLDKNILKRAMEKDE